MDTKFTPGPWSAETDMDGWHHYLAILADGPDFYADAKWPYHPLIAAAYHGRGSAPREIAEANARLIAAAPDMYEALKELLPCVGWSNFTDAELQLEHELGNGAAIKIMKARAALARVQS